MISQAASLNADVLVLNKLWMAIRVIDARRAFSMLFRDLAEVVHVENGSFAGYDFSSWADLSIARLSFQEQQYDWIATVDFRIAVPKVIRLLGYDRLPRQEVKLNRRNIFARDHNICQYCGKHFPTSELSLDHVRPRSQGGIGSWENLVCCCVRCNSKKAGRTPEQALMHLIRKPFKPRKNPAIHLRLGSPRYAHWQQFLDHAYWSVELK